MPLADGYIALKQKTNQLAGNLDRWMKEHKKESFSLPYAYPCDNYIESILSNEWVYAALQKFANKYCNDQIQLLISKSTLVSEQSYPNLYSLMLDCCHILNTDIIPKVYITKELSGINALSAGTDDSPLMFVSPKSVIALSDKELKFMLGHELGHIAQKNLMCHTIKGILEGLNKKSEVLGPMVADLINVPLNQWYRCAEYTADRAGLLCCKDIDVAKKLLLSFADPEEDKALLEYFELDNVHPYMQNRVNELIRFNINL